MRDNITNLRFRPQSLAAPAWLATVGSEAAVTMHLHSPSEESSARTAPRLPASRRSEG